MGEPVAVGNNGKKKNIKRKKTMRKEKREKKTNEQRKKRRQRERLASEQTERGVRKGKTENGRLVQRLSKRKRTSEEVQCVA